MPKLDSWGGTLPFINKPYFTRLTSTLELHVGVRKFKCYITDFVEINILQSKIIMLSCSLCNKSIIFINGNNTREQPRQRHITCTHIRIV